jgi:beta-lactamase regulating signal transducer with metallopeptidase domain
MLDLTMLDLTMLDLTIRGTLLLVAAMLVVASLRRAPAAARHLVWATALAGLLVIPALPAVMPTWTVGVPAMALPRVASVGIPMAPRAVAPIPVAPVPAWSTDRIVVERTAERARSEGGAARAERESAVTVESAAVPVAPVENAAPIAVWWIVWAVGALVVLARLALGMWRLRAVVRATEVIDDPAWTRLVRRAAAELGVSRSITLYRGAAGVVPVTSGIARPIIIVPADADAWDEERRRLVLTHEVAHVRRLDVMTHMVGQVAVALFWFHPLAWVAAARMRLERERACDDLVLAAGVRPSRYAGDLLEMAQVLGGDTVPVAAALAMARRSEIEGRLLAILDSAVRRGPLGARRIVTALAAASVAIVALSVVQPVAATPVPGVHPGHGGPAEEMALADAASAAARLKSDVAKRAILLDVAVHHSTSDAVRRALFAAVATMRSDTERRKVLLASLGRGTRDDATVVEVVRATAEMTSDADKSAVLRTVAGLDDLSEASVRTAFFAAANTIRSESDRAAVLLAVLGEMRARGQRIDAGDGLARAAIASVATMRSATIKARVLRQVVASGWMTNASVLRQFKICLIQRATS